MSEKDSFQLLAPSWWPLGSFAPTGLEGLGVRFSSLNDSANDR
jgi:hypothetical protein